MPKTPKKKTGSGDVTYDPPLPTDRDGKLSVIVEMQQDMGGSPSFAMTQARNFSLKGFNLDEEFEPVSMMNTSKGMTMGPGSETFILRGTVKNEAEMEQLRSQPGVADVWKDTPISPFPGQDDLQPENAAAASCPIPPCDCSPGTPKGTIADVANYLGVDKIWAKGIRGTGIVVGVLDSGITAQGRPVKNGETNKRISRVIGGWPSDWGTESGKWGNHGNMCATDVLGMAPQAQLYDLRIAGDGGSPGTISRALQAFNWAITQHRVDGTPQILTNSWGIFQEAWDSTYARNPNHPFTRKVVEAINEGILVLFAAGNCGSTCPDNRCASDNGPGKSIWGANGHPLVMTVGAVNKNEQFIGYSSQGPAALDTNKPDFCSISHFTGYNYSDNGTSAATPILAGVVALLKQAKPNLSQNRCKSALKATAKNIGPSGFDRHSGAGIIQAYDAYKRLTTTVSIPTLRPGCRTLRPTCPTVLTRRQPCKIPTRSPACLRPTLRPPCELPTRTPSCRPTRRPPCGPPTRTPACGLPTRRPPCGPPTRTPGCTPTRRPPCGPPTRTPACGPTTFRPPCRPTRRPVCVPPTRRPVCGPPTSKPPCRPTRRPGCQPPPTRRPPCGPTRRPTCNIEPRRTLRGPCEIRPIRPTIRCPRTIHPAICNPRPTFRGTCPIPTRVCPTRACNYPRPPAYRSVEYDDQYDAENTYNIYDSAYDVSWEEYDIEETYDALDYDAYWEDDVDDASATFDYEEYWDDGIDDTSAALDYEEYWDDDVEEASAALDSEEYWQEYDEEEDWDDETGYDEDWDDENDW